MPSSSHDFFKLLANSSSPKMDKNSTSSPRRTRFSAIFLPTPPKTRSKLPIFESLKINLSLEFPIKSMFEAPNTAIFEEAAIFYNVDCFNSIKLSKFTKYVGPTMDKFKLIFGETKAVIGVIHLQALPGTPRASLSPNAIIEKALDEARIYQKAGIDALLVENMHDVPYLKIGVGPEIVSLMTLVSYLVKQETKLPVGLQILAGANKAALAAAHSSTIDFIRAEGFVFGHMADEGYIDAQAGELLRFRKQLNADHIAVFTDLKKKHASHALTADISLKDTAKAAQFFLSDGLIVTGEHTGSAPLVSELESLQQVDVPVLLGSGITEKNISTYYSLANAFIVGSHFKENGHWSNALSYDRVAQFMTTFHKLDLP